MKRDYGMAVPTVEVPKLSKHGKKKPVPRPKPHYPRNCVGRSPNAPHKIKGPEDENTEGDCLVCAVFHGKKRYRIRKGLPLDYEAPFKHKCGTSVRDKIMAPGMFEIILPVLMKDGITMQGEGCWIWKGRMNFLKKSHRYIPVVSGCRAEDQRCSIIVYRELKIIFDLDSGSRKVSDGPVPSSVECHHACFGPDGNPICVNPAHMQWMSTAEHNRHHGIHGCGSSASGYKTHCSKGHSLHGAGARIYSDGHCSYCSRMRANFFRDKAGRNIEEYSLCVERQRILYEANVVTDIATGIPAAPTKSGGFYGP